MSVVDAADVAGRSGEHSLALVRLRVSLLRPFSFFFFFSFALFGFPIRYSLLMGVN